MKPEERIYFEKKSNYTRNIKYQEENREKWFEIQNHVGVLSSQIRNAARGALEGEVSPTKAKREISDLIKIINKLKKEFI